MHKTCSHVLAGAHPRVASWLQQRRVAGVWDYCAKQEVEAADVCLAAGVRCHPNKLLSGDTQSSLASAKHMSLHSPKNTGTEHRAVWKKIQVDCKCLFHRNLLVDC